MRHKQHREDFNEKEETWTEMAIHLPKTVYICVIALRINFIMIAIENTTGSLIPKHMYVHHLLTAIWNCIG